MKTFDQELRKRFPGIQFYRYINEAYIATTRNDKVLLDDNDMYQLLEDVSLSGSI